MANILYGVNGEGSGHSTRAKEVISHLTGKGHTVRVVSFDRGLQNLSKSFDVTEIFGFRFAYVNNRVRYRRTAAKNLLTTPKAAQSFVRLVRKAEEWKIDVVITDFEPLTCYVGHRKHLPVISIDNQHCLTNTDISLPHKYRRDAAAAKLVTRLMTPHAGAYLVTSFFAARPRKRNTFVFPPILRQEVLGIQASVESHVLVYVTSPAPELAAMLKQVRCRFVAYGFGVDGQDGNVLFKKPSMDGFLADLATCQAIVANAGFSLVSEALHLGKPYLAIPVKHQFEQIFNAFYLDKNGYGAFWDDLSKEKIESFLFNLPHYAECLGGYRLQDNSALFAKLDELVESFSGTSRPRRGRRFQLKGGALPRKRRSA
ncbi:MAG: glycosyltransferase family protein [Actinomycetota bacterium]